MSDKTKTQAPQAGYKISGGRTGVLLVHSLGGTPVELRYLAQAFGREGFTVSCPFVPGMTAGTDVSGISQFEDWYIALEAAYRDLAQTCDTIYVGGLSAGAILSLLLAQRQQEKIAGVLLFAPTLWPNGWAIPWYFNFFRLVRERFSARLFHFRQRAPYGIKDERIRKFVIESFSAEDRPIEDLFGRGGGLVYQFRRLVREVVRGLNTIETPALIMHPRFDDQSDLSNAFKLQRKLGGLVETVVLDDCYHMITLDRQRHLVVERAMEFVGRHSVAAAARVVTPMVGKQLASAGKAL
jgi:carboxylesterase